jgi:hypothetical protein
MIRNRILITLALWLLKMVNMNKIEHKNSWEHYVNKISEFK